MKRISLFWSTLINNGILQGVFLEVIDNILLTFYFTLYAKWGEYRFQSLCICVCVCVCGGGEDDGVCACVCLCVCLCVCFQFVFCLIIDLRY